MHLGSTFQKDPEQDLMRMAMLQTAQHDRGVRIEAFSRR